MTKSEKERVQYLLTQLIEGESTEDEKKQLYASLLKDQENTEWENILEELIASEPEQQNYDPEEWNVTARNILNTMGQKVKENEPGVEAINLPGRKKWMWIAAVAAMFMLAFSLWFVFPRSDKSLIRTKYGQQKKIALQDETQIVLNSNSTITYLKRWQNGQPREVWLSGEALFSVKHIDTGKDPARAAERFLVHTDVVNIEVLGTVFNVRERRGKTEIVLEQGKIRLSFNKSDKPDIIMEPGQIVTVEPANKEVRVDSVKSADYTAWTKKKLVLTDASFKQIVEYMEDNFGKRIILTDPALANRKVEGTFKIDNMDDALLVLSKALNVHITQKEDTLIFTPQ